MLKNKLIIGTLLIGLFSTGFVAKDKDYEAAKKPSITLEKKDLDLLAKAKSKNFKNLTAKEKAELLKFLDDYAASAKKEKVVTKDDLKNKKTYFILCMIARYVWRCNCVMRSVCAYSRHASWKARSIGTF